MKPYCWLSRHGSFEGERTPCEGPLRKAHLVPWQRLRKLAPFRDGQVDRWDPRLWVPACGGYGYGCSGHHGAYDQARTIRVARDRIPVGLERLFAELGVAWLLDREFGML